MARDEDYSLRLLWSGLAEVAELWGDEPPKFPGGDDREARWLTLEEQSADALSAEEAEELDALQQVVSEELTRWRTAIETRHGGRIPGITPDQALRLSPSVRSLFLQMLNEMG